MKVYRIQDEAGKGPYARTDVCISYDTYRHPLPYEDSGMSGGWSARETSHEWRFGFLSLGQFRSWFYRDDDVHALWCVGLALTEWEVDDAYVIPGNAQCAFVRDKAALVGTHDLRTFIS